MIELVFFLMLVGGSDAVAKESCSAPMVDKEKLVSFIKKKSDCFVGVAGHDVSGCYFPEFLCVLNSTFGTKTIKETDGCTVAYFNSKNGVLRGTAKNPYGGRNNIIMAKNKDCLHGGFAELMKQITFHGLVDDSAKPKDVTVDEMLHKGTSADVPNATLIYLDDKVKSIYGP